MALATRCPHCQTAFRVASDQLKLRAGLVRCGTCKQIFNGIENLLRPDEDIPAALAASAPPLPPVPLLDGRENAFRPPRGDNTRFNDLIAEVDYPEQARGVPQAPPQVASSTQPAPGSPSTYTPSPAPGTTPASGVPQPGRPGTAAASKGYAANYAPVPLPGVASDADADSRPSPSRQDGVSNASREPLLFAFDTPPKEPPTGVSGSSSDALWAALDDLPHEAGGSDSDPDSGLGSDHAAHSGADADSRTETDDDTLPDTAAALPSGVMPHAPSDVDADPFHQAAAGDTTSPATGVATVPAGATLDLPAGFGSTIDPGAENAGVMPGLLRAARIDADEDVTLPIRAPSPRPVPALAEPAVEVPDFIARDQQEQGTQRVLRPVLWSVGALLSLLLAGQLVYAMRSPIAANFPQFRAALDAACRTLGCLVALPMQIESVSIESSDFQPVPDKREQFMLSVVLRNRSSTVEAWPAIELSLNDAGDKTVGRRVILPREYLPPGQTTARGFAAGSEQTLKVYFDLARLPASGYRVYLFYP